MCKCGKFYPQPKSSLEKIKEQLDKLYSVEDTLGTILNVSGRDPETVYTLPYLDLLDRITLLRASLQVLLDEYSDAINDVDYELEPQLLDAVGEVTK